MFEDSVVTAVCQTVGDDFTEDQVRRVLAALDGVREGAEIGTVVQDPKSGAVACRVSEAGVPLWRVTALDGSCWRDVQPRLDGWTVIAEAPGE